MRVVQKLLSAIAFFLASVACGCAPNAAYLNAVTSFANTTSDSVKALELVSNTTGKICRGQSAAYYLALNLMGTPPAPSREKYYTAPEQTKNNELSWQVYCADIQADGKRFSALLDLLASYSSAMKLLAGQGTWDGTSAKDMTSNLSKLAGSQTPAGQILAGLVSPAQQLGSVIVLKYTAYKTQKYAADAEPYVQGILKGLGDYIDAVERDVVEPAVKKHMEVVDLLESKSGVWTPPLDVGRVIQFTVYAQSVDDDIASIRLTFDAYKALIAKLRAGHTVLAEKREGEAGADALESAVTEILTSLGKSDTGVAGDQ